MRNDKIKTTIFELKIERLMKSPNIENTEKLSLLDYFKVLEEFICFNKNIETLTTIFTKENYVTSKPYLIWRELEPIDKRFEKIYLIYEEKKPLGAIRWKFKINLGELIEIFGQPYLRYTPFDDSTTFSFKSKMSKKHVFSTLKVGIYNENNLNNLEFDFLSLDLIYH